MCRRDIVRCAHSDIAAFAAVIFYSTQAPAGISLGDAEYHVPKAHITRRMRIELKKASLRMLFSA